MNEEEFWNTIQMFDWDKSGDDEAVLNPAVQYLAKKTNEEIFEFEEIMAQKLQSLDTKAHAQNIGEGAYVNDNEYFSVDGFLYSRCVVVANGKNYFETVLTTPKDFPKDMEFESILYLAQEAYERKNKTEWNYSSTTDYETFKNISG